MSWPSYVLVSAAVTMIDAASSYLMKSIHPRYGGTLKDAAMRRSAASEVRHWRSLAEDTVRT